MAIIRVNKTNNYTIISNTPLRDMNLSLKAKGLITQMLSLPEDWDYSIAGLAKINRESDNSIKTALDELKAAGYLIVTKLLPNQTNTGRIEYVYDLYEEPQDQKQEGEKQGTEIQGVEIQGVEVQGLEIGDNKIKNNKELNNKEKSNKGKSISKAQAEILDSVDVIAGDENLRKAFEEFIKMRLLIKKPLTDHGLKLIINDTFKYAKGDPGTMRAIVEQSIRNSWQGVFPLKAAQDATGGKRASALDQLEAMAAEEGIAL